MRELYDAALLGDVLKVGRLLEEGCDIEWENERVVSDCLWENGVGVDREG